MSDDVTTEVSRPVRLPESPPGALRITKTELVWPGKYNDTQSLSPKTFGRR